MLLRTSKDCARIENTYTNKVQVDSTSNTLMHEYSGRKKLYNQLCDIAESISFSVHRLGTK
jgi:hypothetical protein